MTTELKAVPSDTVLYAAFLHFCVATRLNFDAIAAAARAAGGTALPMPDPKDAFPMRQGYWRIPFRGHDFLVEASAQHRPDTNPPQFHEACRIQAKDVEDGALAAIGKWSGVPETLEMPGFSGQHYFFIERSGIHTSISPFDRSEKDGFWTLSTLELLNTAGVELRRQRPETR